LDRFEAIQESFEQRLGTQALADMPSGSTERPLSPETSDLIRSLFGPTTPPHNEALTDRPSGSVQQPRLLEARAGQKRAEPSHADSGCATELAPHPTKKAGKVITDETLLTIHSAVQAAQATGQALNKTELARALGVSLRTLTNYVINNELTVDARNRLARITGEGTGVRTEMTDELLLALDAEVSSGRPFNASEFARRHGITRTVVSAHVCMVDRQTRRAEITPRIKTKLDRIKGNAPRPDIRNARLETGYWQALKSEVDGGRPLDTKAFAAKYALLTRTVWRDAKRLREQAASQSARPGSVESTALQRCWSVMRRVEPRDLVALREERARGGPFDRSAWAQRLGLSPYSVCKYVTAKGELTAMGLSRLE
jgi:plasmid maintenance system antidote protein VapI